MKGSAVFENAWYTFTVGELFAPQAAYGQGQDQGPVALQHDG